ncbi:pyridoxamine 5'-phosphate oxidase family protein [Priestia filamentosa]|uniref:General stress protein n=1 Tax=Priestia filamentosa TaxID=1402861 RepID=A0A1X7DFG0_9BACI|nr:pyridoxamine 5'-phosphate oxidase family protein [Priestia filamentosa]AKO93493.1 general stress protein [Priestia filamentosa]MDT3763685.1 pyridoxamine 5'-phosphate oxidase family protein [Priestia filamentosa]OXS71819.1 general stress protein [Priestia filamentosa]RJS63201.1 general stress protein [Priestia filamentosa]WCM14334.1 pyridoxamine 5'-phosphate oxidase family protein [Priestia filamentosa]
MTVKDVKEKIAKVLENNKIGTLATIEGNKPNSRYMTFFNDDLTLYTPTSKETHKTEEIEKNSNVHILLGYDGKGLGDSYVEIEGTAEIYEDQKMKNELWEDEFEHWFDGKDDPNYIILKITPSQIRLMNEKGQKPQTVTV